MHSVRADKVLIDLSAESKYSLDWHFLQDLHRRGLATGHDWLAVNLGLIGKRSSVDLRAQFL
jgi:hypothetical protein